MKKKADAERYRVEQAAEADKNRRIREAEAEQFQIEAEAKAQAEGTRARGSAEAEVIRAKGLAEAEAKEKLAEAFEKYGEAAVLDILAKMLPELAGRIAEPIGKIDKISVVDGGGGQGATRVAGYVTELMASSNEMLSNVAGVDLNALARRLVGATEDTPRVPPQLTHPKPSRGDGATAESNEGGPDTAV